MRILQPTTVLPAMLAAGTTIPEVDTSVGEVAWAGGVNYATDARAAYGGKIYRCVKAHTSLAGTPPDSPTLRDTWLFEKPTNRMAPFDEYLYTKATAKGEIVYAIKTSFVDGLALYGLEADNVEIKYRELPSGNQIGPTIDGYLWEQAYGEWEYLFGNLALRTNYTRQDVPMRPSLEIEIRIKRNIPTEDVAIGYIGVGKWSELFAPNTLVGGTQYGVEVTPKSYALFKKNDDGTYIREEGRTAKIINATVLISAMQAPQAEDLLRKILNKPVAVQASDLSQYRHIATFGFVTGSVTSETWATARVNLKVEGNI